MVSKIRTFFAAGCTLVAVTAGTLPTTAQVSQDAATVTRRQAQKVSLTGKVINAKTGEPLPGTSIYFADSRNGAASNQNGKYRIQNLARGVYLVEVSHLGFASIVENITLEGDVEKNFTLAPSVVENEAVTITGVSAATSVRKSPIAVDIVRREDLMRIASTNLIDALSRTPGVSQISTGPAISKPVIRGLGYNRLVVVNDGIRQEGQQWGDEHGIEIDEYSVSKTEILKGPASIMYGSDALAGVVNILSNVPVAEGTIAGNLLTNYQTNNGLRGLHGNVAGNINGFNWNAYGTFRSAYDYRNSFDGRVFNSGFNERNFGGYVGLNKSWGYSHLLISNFNQTLGVVEGDRDSLGRFLKLVNSQGIEEEVVADGRDFTSRDPYLPRQHINHLKISSDNSFRLGKSRLSLTAGYQRNDRQEFGNVLLPSEKELFFKLQTLTVNLQYHLPEYNNWRTTIGVNGMHQANKNRGVEALIPEYSLFDAGAFVYTKKAFNHLTLSGGLRFDERSIHSRSFRENNEVKFAAFSRKFSNASGSAGLSYEASQALTLKLNLARGFRAPSIPELASNGAHEGTNRYEYGQTNLRSETSWQVDAGIDINSEHVSLAASLFYNSIEHFIYYRKLSSVAGGDSVINIEGNDNIAFTFDQQNARLYGIECNVDIHPHAWHWLHIENSFSYVRGIMDHDQDGSRNLPFIPAARLVSQLRGDFAKDGKMIRNAYVSLELDNTFAQDHAFTGFDTETASPGYSLLNAGVGGEVVHRGKTIFSLFLTGSNLTDKSYQSHLSRLKYTDENALTGRRGVFNMGRNFSIKLNIPIRLSVSS